MTDTLISVVIPTCNRLDMLKRCLESLERQTYEEMEIIVVDDCSTDGTPEFLAEYAERCPKTFRWFHNDHNLGANPTRNKGIRDAKGDLIAFLDCDVVVCEEWVAEMRGCFVHDKVAGATGIVEDTPPTNIYDLTFKGTHRVYGKVRPTRLTAQSMCIRRDLLLQYGLDEDRASQPTTADGRPDLSVSGRGDEEGLMLVLKAAGYEFRLAHKAISLHEKVFTRQSFFRQAYLGGRSAARLVYKFCLPPRLDMAPFMLAYASLPLALIDWRFVGVFAFFMFGALAAITYNDLVRKKKTPFETLKSFPVLVAYYHVRLFGYVKESIRLRVTRHDIPKTPLKPQTERAATE